MKRSLFYLSVCLLFATIIFAENEPNNTIQTANTLTLNTTDSGALNEGTSSITADNDDYWKFTLTVDGSIYFETNATGNLDADLFIYDVNGLTQIASGTRYGLKDWVKHTYLKAGTYYLRIYRTGGTGSYSLLNRFTAAPYSNDAEPNDTYQTALSLGLNSSVTGHLGYYSNSNTDRDDYYKFVITQDGGIKFTVDSDSADIDLYIIDTNGDTQIKSASAYGLKETIEFPNLLPGTYYLRLYLTNSHGGYTLTSTYTATSINGVTTNDAENNDSPAKAVSFANFTANGTVTGYGHIGFYSNSYTDPDDYYVINTTSNGKLVVTTETNSTLDVDLYLIDNDASTTQIRSANAYGTTETLTFDNLGIGKFYLRVYKATGYGSYKITATFTVPSMANDSEPNDIFSQAKLISTDTKITGHLGYYALNKTDYDDYYQINLASKWDSLYIRSDSEAALDVDLYLLNSTGQSTLASAYAYGAKEILKTSNVAAGTYLVRAYRTMGQGAYALKVTTKYANISGALTDIQKQEVLPTSFDLSQNYPNPFNPSTKIKYSLPSNEFVTLKIYDMLGREVMTVVNEEKPAGSYEVNFDAKYLSSGIYLYKIAAGDFVQTRKMILMK